LIDSIVNGRVLQFDVLGRAAGSQGFPGFQPSNELNESRSNIGAYVDAEFDFTDRFMIGAAVRYENYSDFGNTLNAKLSTRLELTDNVAIRGSLSTGFRAPSLAQIYYNTTFTDFVSGVAIDKLIAKNNSPITRTLGIPELKQETAFNVSAGFTANFSNFTATVDGYYVDIKDRIVLTGAFEDTDPDIGADLQLLGVSAAQFFTNALSTTTTGLDVILTYSALLGNNRLRLALVGNFNDIELGEINVAEKLKGKEDIYFSRREQLFLLASAPPSKIALTTDYRIGKFNANLRLTRFGEIVTEDFLGTEDVYKPRIVTDLTLGLQLNKNLMLNFGAANLFNVYPTQQDTETETGGLWDAVQMGFAGSFYFAKLGFRF
jgi:iron complex outermembrane receptor protein